MFAIIGSLMLIIAVILYILIVLGLPYGEFSMGGKYKIVPSKYRPIYIISIVFQIIAIIVLLQVGKIIPLVLSLNITRTICYVFAIYFSINVVANAFSNSKKEKYFITPISLVATICFWMTLL